MVKWVSRRKGTWLTAEDCWVATGEPHGKEDGCVSTCEVCLVEEGSEATGGPPAALEGPDEHLALFCEG